MIPKSTIDEIFDAAIIEDVVGEFVALKKRGANYLGNCPFHNEKSPSFTVSPAKGIYKCFGCGKAGNSINFIMEHEHYSYPEALRYLANKYNIEVEEEEQTDEQKQVANEKESLFVVSNYASKYFKDQMHNSQAGKAIGLSYFKERGFREEIIEKFELGYSPDEWSAFTDTALKDGHSIEFLEKSGLTIVKEDKKFDRFKGRVMFPIHNLSGRVLGFGGRILKTDAKAAKYLNSPESEIYHKSKVLYGIYFAKKEIIQQDNCYLVEGYTDVISLHQSGVENVVSSSGTSLTEGQIRLIKRFTENITILYDGDAAGLKASFRGIDMILQEGMNVRVVLFPDGEDPDSYAKNHSSEELTKYITESAQDFIRFKTSVLLEEVGTDPIKKAELIKEIVASIAIIPDQIKRSIYTQECSSLLDIGEQALINETNKILRGKASKSHHQPFDEGPPPIEDFYEPREEKSSSISNKIAHWEHEIIRLLISYGAETITVDVVDENEETQKQDVLVAVYILSNINNDGLTFDNPILQDAFNHYVEIVNEERVPTHQDFINHLNQDISKLAIDVLSNKYEISENWRNHGIFVKTEDSQVKIAVFNTVFAFKACKVESLIEDLNLQLKNEKDDDEQIRLMTEYQHLKKVQRQLSEKLGRIILK
ncbi:MAG: DNA primase [Flavobacteriales bacterium]|nr:DNA primase [Flavobacteriales bacterium]MCB9364491.1 DNA primase [Flavobacteriales bacterium]